MLARTEWFVTLASTLTAGDKMDAPMTAGALCVRFRSGTRFPWNLGQSAGAGAGWPTERATRRRRSLCSSSDPHQARLSVIPDQDGPDPPVRPILCGLQKCLLESATRPGPGRGSSLYEHCPSANSFGLV